MTLDVNALIAQAKASTDKLEDQTKVQEGGFEYETPAAGKTPARFIGYVELGKRPQRAFQGKAKPDADEVRIIFELNGKAHKKDIGEGQIVTNMIAVKLTKKLNEKAGFTKLFNKMVRGRDGITHMAQMLGEAFLIDIVHNTVEAKEGKPARTYANMKDTDGAWLIAGPRFENPMSGEWVDVPVEAPTKPIQLLLWDAPTKEQWESLFIDGTRTVKDEKGQEREVSKNWLQEDILQNAVNLEGSALQAMLGGIADLTLEPEDGDALGNGDAPAAPGSAPDTTGSADTAAPSESEPSTPAESDADVLASLGL